MHDVNRSSAKVCPGAIDGGLEAVRSWQQSEALSSHQTPAEVAASPAAESMKLVGRLGDSPPTAPPHRPQALDGFPERHVVERLKAANVESQQAPVAALVALPASLAVHAEDRAEEIPREATCYLTVRVADVDLVAIE